MQFILKTLMIYVAGLSMSLAQTTSSAEQAEDPTVSERARLGNQRIQVEAELRAREEQRRLEEAEQARLRAEEAEQARLRAEEAAQSSAAASSAPSATPGASRRDSGVDTSRTLQQLRMLGELKDDGYITAEEFERIKQKILDTRF